jgi:hypothetical protein
MTNSETDDDRFEQADRLLRVCDGELHPIGTFLRVDVIWIHCRQDRAAIAEVPLVGVIAATEVIVIPEHLELQYLAHIAVAGNTRAMAFPVPNDVDVLIGVRG